MSMLLPRSHRLAQCVLAGALAAAVLVTGVLTSPPAAAEQGELRSQVATEARLQAAYLLKFPAYVDWPAGRQPARGATVIALTNADDVAEEVRKIAERMEPGVRPTVKTVRAGDSLAGVHLLYVGGDDWPRYQRWVQQAQTHAALLVSSHPGALDDGSMINFRVVGERLRFEISMAAAEKANLKIGAPLLSLAVVVDRRK